MFEDRIDHFSSYVNTATSQADHNLSPCRLRIFDEFEQCGDLLAVRCTGFLESLMKYLKSKSGGGDGAPQAGDTSNTQNNVNNTQINNQDGGSGAPRSRGFSVKNGNMTTNNSGR